MSRLTARLFAGRLLGRPFGQSRRRPRRRWRLGQVVQLGLQQLHQGFQFSHPGFQGGDASKVLATAWTFSFHNSRLAAGLSCQLRVFYLFRESVR